MPNPFGSTFESFGAPRGPLVEKVYQDQFETLTALLEEGEGQLISLRAPRAGYGKTMLLSRLQQASQAQTLFIPVPFGSQKTMGLLMTSVVLESTPENFGKPPLDGTSKSRYRTQ